MHDVKYVVYKEGKHYVAQCLNVEVSSFGDTVDEAVQNITEALELYFEDNDSPQYIPIEMAMIGEKRIEG
jgi:predicted RNase H-like HicB family nuclease